MLNRRSVISGLGALPVAAPAYAQNWPTKPVRIIVSQAAGGTPDILCRFVMEGVGQRIGQPIVVENRPGGANVIGAQAAARSAPDGYTLFWATAAALVTNPYTFKSLSYNPQSDFVAVGKVADGPFVLLAHPSVAASSVSELVALSKSQPQALTIATDGPRNFSGLVAAWINKLGAMNLQQVPYANMPQGIQDTVAGRVALIILAIPSAASFIASKALKPLGLTTRERAPGYEQITPIAETFPGFDFSGWMSVVAPARTPDDILERLNRALDSVLREPQTITRLRELGFYTKGAGTRKETADFIQAQYEAFGRVVREIGLQAE